MYLQNVKNVNKKMRGQGILQPWCSHIENSLLFSPQTCPRYKIRQMDLSLGIQLLNCSDLKDCKFVFLLPKHCVPNLEQIYWD